MMRFSRQIQVARWLIALLIMVASFGLERYFYSSAKIWPLRYAFLGVLVFLALSVLREVKASRLKWFTLLWLVLGSISYSSYLIYLKKLGPNPSAESLVQKSYLAAFLFCFVMAVFLSVGAEIGFLYHSKPRRIKKNIFSFLYLGLLVCVLSGLNFFALKNNKTFDMSFLKAASVSQSTEGLIKEALFKTELEVAVFFPKSHEILSQIKPYFNSVENKKLGLKVSYFDKDTDAQQAEAFKVSRNGQIVLKSKGNFERIDLGLNFNAARKQIRTFDQEFQRAVRQLTTERKTIYFSSGHNELTWRGGDDKPEDQLKSAKLLEVFIRNQNFNLKVWGTGEGSLKEVPSDAAALLILGPKIPFQKEEVASIRSYLEKNGKLMLFFDLDAPDAQELKSLADSKRFSNDPLVQMMSGFGVNFQAVPLANENNHIKATNSPIDRWFLFTNQFGTHESIPSLARNDERLAFLSIKTGYFKFNSRAGNWDVIETVRSMQDSFNDVNRNFEFDEKNNESKASYTVGLALKDNKPNSNAKMVIGASAGAFSDAVIRNPGNLFYFADSLKWINGDTASLGALTSEEDVKIVHSRNEDLVYFYGSVVTVPGLVLLAGFISNRQRRRSKPARKA